MIVLAAAACGSDDRSSGTDAPTDTESPAETDAPAETDSSAETSAEAGDGADLTADQQAAVDQFMGQEDAEAVFDRDCVEDKASELSEEDAQAIADAGPDGSPELSEAGAALTVSLAACIDNDALVEEFISGMQESGEEFDEQCVRDGLEGFDMAEIAVAGSEGEMPDGLLSSLIDCFEIDLGS
jgi:hypothetical protein